MRLWWLALGAAGFVAGSAWPVQEPERHWLARNGVDWRRLGHDAQTAYVEGFLAGAALGQAAGVATDSAGLTEAVARLRRGGELRFPYGSNVYASRISDFYWWENHRPLPTWYAFWEVNALLTGPK
jgi:hypothetical protein